MTSTNRLKSLENKLNPRQIKAAHLLARNSFLKKGNRLNKEERQRKKENGEVALNQQEIADLVGVSDKQLYNWRMNNQDFIEYVNGLSVNWFKSKLPDIMNKHLEMTLEGQGSMKGVELFYKFGGLLTDKAEVKHAIEESETEEELEEKLENLKKKYEESDEVNESDEN